MITLFALLSGLTLLISYLVYFRQMIRGYSNPNPSSWFIWSLVMIMNALTYHQILIHNPIKAVTAYVAALCLISISIYALLRKRFSRIHYFDGISVFLALCTGIFWQLTNNAFLAQIALQIILVLSYIPTLYGIYKGHASEQVYSWVLVVMSYIFLVISIMLDYRGHWIELLFPLVNGILGNGLVVIFILKKKNS